MVEKHPGFVSPTLKKPAVFSPKKDECTAFTGSKSDLRSSCFDSNRSTSQLYFAHKKHLMQFDAICVDFIDLIHGSSPNDLLGNFGMFWISQECQELTSHSTL